MEKVKRRDIIAAVSIYSSRIASCVAKRGDDGAAQILGVGQREGKFMGGKGILDIDGLSNAVRESLFTAQQEAGVGCGRAVVSISGGCIQSDTSNGMIVLGQRGEEITYAHIKEALKMANTIPGNIDREVIHSVPQDFVVDGQNRIKNPLGLYGVKLEAETMVITAHVPFVQNITKCLNLAGIELEDMLFSGLALSYAVLSEETEDKGILLIEIDNQFSTLSVFFDNTIRGIHILQDSVVANGVLGRLKREADRIRTGKPISKIILAGGSYVHEDFIEKVDSEFGIPSQMAYARNLRGSAKDIKNPAFLTAIGAVRFGLEKREEKTRKRDGFMLINRLRRKVNNFVGEYF